MSAAGCFTRVGLVQLAVWPCDLCSTLLNGKSSIFKFLNFHNELPVENGFGPNEMVRTDLEVLWSLVS